VVAIIVTEKWNREMQIWEPHSMQTVNVQITPTRIYARVGGAKRQFGIVHGEEIKSGRFRRFILPDSIKEGKLRESKEGK